jgi:glucose uptake protein GlcU
MTNNKLLIRLIILVLSPLALVIGFCAGIVWGIGQAIHDIMESIRNPEETKFWRRR